MLKDRHPNFSNPYKLKFSILCMKKQTALKAVLIISIAGLLFSGYLSYSEIFKRFCALGTCSAVVGVPACVYGFAMYLVLFIVSIVGLRSKN